MSIEYMEAVEAMYNARNFVALEEAYKHEVVYLTLAEQSMLAQAKQVFADQLQQVIDCLY